MTQVKAIHGKINATTAIGTQKISDSIKLENSTNNRPGVRTRLRMAKDNATFLDRWLFSTPKSSQWSRSLSIRGARIIAMKTKGAIGRAQPTKPRERNSLITALGNTDFPHHKRRVTQQGKPSIVAVGRTGLEPVTDGL